MIACYSGYELLKVGNSSIMCDLLLAAARAASKAKATIKATRRAHDSVKI